MSDLANHIRSTTLVDTHEHLRSEAQYLNNGPDALGDIFHWYMDGDLVSAGADPADVKRVAEKPEGRSITERFKAIESAWRHCQFTGYGEAVRLCARDAYGIEGDLTAEVLEAANEKNRAYRQSGQRLKILRDRANLDHVQIDDFVWECLPDASGPDFFLFDLSWKDFAAGDLDFKKMRDVLGIDVTNLQTLEDAMRAIFARWGGCAIAVKTQHAYARTLRWAKLEMADVTKSFEAVRAGNPSVADRLCLGDWCLGRGVELATEMNLPVKIHTGYHAGSGYMRLDDINPALLSPLLREYPKARFVLMHIGYPYEREMVALAKHFQNVWVDMCWAWSIDPHTSSDFVRQMIHAAPSNKLFIFGGDTGFPNTAAAFASQARSHLTRTLEAEVSEGLLTESQAIELATKMMRSNQFACFDIKGRRNTIRAHS